MRISVMIMVALSVAFAGPPQAYAQSAGNLFVTQSDGGNSSTYYWGTVSPGVSGASASATMHAADGNAAAQVNAAKKGFLFPGNMSIYAIGVQNIVSSTISGDNNVVDQNVTQSGSNTGAITNNGTINND